MRPSLRVPAIVVAAVVLAAPGVSDAQSRGPGAGPAIGGVLRGGSSPVGAPAGGGRVGAPGGWGRMGAPGMPSSRPGWGGRGGAIRLGAPPGRGSGGYYGGGRSGRGYYGGADYGKGYGYGYGGGRFRHRGIGPTVVVVPWVGPYGVWQSGYYWDGYAPVAYGSDAWSDDDDEPRVPRTAVIEAAPVVPDAAALVVESLDGGASLRLRWTGRDPGVREVTLAVADAARRVLASQSVHEAPYTALFDRAGRVAFVGVTVVRTDGVTTTTFVPIDLTTARER